MKTPVVMIGMGEMAGVFSRGLLRLGHPVFPVTRGMDLHEAADSYPIPEAVIISVGEKDLPATLEAVPAQWRDRLVLLQNELLPKDWKAYCLSHPTVISVWFEKKPGQDFKVLIPSPVFGPHAKLIQDALGTLGIPVRIVDNNEKLLFELVCKNVYILTTNISGLEVGGNVDELWNKNQTLAREVADEVMDIQQWLSGKTLDREALIQGMVMAMEGDPQHQCMGRSAPARLGRAIEQADQAKLDVPKLRELAQAHRVFH
jgi:hypothetical protein